jgi:hypothetical protein
MPTEEERRAFLAHIGHVIIASCAIGALVAVVLTRWLLSGC